MRWNILKVVLHKNAFLASLCAEYGCPAGVADALKEFTDKHSFLRMFFRKDIESYEAETEAWIQAEYEQYLERTIEKEEEDANPCFSCGWGNGEGGCTIPDYCPHK